MIQLINATIDGRSWLYFKQFVLKQSTPSSGGLINGFCFYFFVYFFYFFEKIVNFNSLLQTNNYNYN